MWILSNGNTSSAEGMDAAGDAGEKTVPMVSASWNWQTWEGATS